MTVGELIELLQAFDEDAEVTVWSEDGQYFELGTVARDNSGDVGINWREKW